MRILTLLTLFIFTLLADDIDEFSLAKITTGSVNQSSYFNSLHMPNVYRVTKCQEKCKENCCWSEIKNQSGNTLHSFSRSDDVSSIASGRYKDVAYLMFSRTYGSKDDRQTDYYLVDQNYKKYAVPKSAYSSIDNTITKQRDLIEIKQYGIYKNGLQILPSKAIEIAKIANNPEGDISVVAVLEESDKVVASNLKEWQDTSIFLTKHGDRKGILSVYPKNSNESYLAIYKLVNIYNKGIMSAHIHFDTKKVKKGWLFNSAERNVGFDPSLYFDGKTLHVGATDSTNKQALHMYLSEAEYQNIDLQDPKHIQGFEEEAFLDLLAGVGISQTYWEASSSISKDSGDKGVELASIEYDISSSLYKSLYFEGRIASTHLSVAFLKNEAEKIGGLTKQASQILNFVVDFDGLISDSSTLRLKVLKGNINGIATFNDKKESGISLTPDGTQSEFKSEMVRYSAYLMAERGYYAGVEYSNFTTPSAVGFSDASKTITHYMMDNNFEIKTYGFLIGYDELSYAKRYEVDLSRFYIQAFGGLGWNDFTLSSETQEQVASEIGKKVLYTGSLAIDAGIDIGYIFQQRFKAARGLGYSFTAGYRVRGSYTGSGQSKDSDNTIEDNELKLEMSRYDIWHGPYLSANILF